MHTMINKIVKCEIFQYHYAISGYHSKELSSLDASYAGHEQADGSLFHGIAHKEDGLQLIICLCYLWEIVLNVGLDT
jgi:hypothetical protein